MFVLPKGTLVHYRGMPFELLEDVQTNGLKSNYDLVAGDQPMCGTGSDAAAAEHRAYCASRGPADGCYCDTATSASPVRAEMMAIEEGFAKVQRERAQNRQDSDRPTEG